MLSFFTLFYYLIHRTNQWSASYFLPFH